MGRVPGQHARVVPIRALTADTDTWHYSLSPHVDSIGEARGHVRAALSEHADPDTVDRIELVVSELVTNSIRHGPGEPITLRLATTDEGDVVGAVEDRGEGVVEMRQPDLDKLPGGLGLSIVDSLASDWGVYPDTTHVWFRFEAAA
jgi:anti-sigma regulatory factor (Ser/Thr protein kinase)